MDCVVFMSLLCDTTINTVTCSDYSLRVDDQYFSIKLQPCSCK